MKRQGWFNNMEEVEMNRLNRPMNKIAYYLGQTIEAMIIGIVAYFLAVCFFSL